MTTCLLFPEMAPAPMLCVVCNKPEYHHIHDTTGPIVAGFDPHKFEGALSAL